MSNTTSPSTQEIYGLKKVCQVWDVSRSTYYARQKRLAIVNAKSSKETMAPKRGPKPLINDLTLLGLIKKDIDESPFKGEGHKKIHARLKKQNIKVGRNRVLKIMKTNNLLSPHRGKQGRQNCHDGTIITEAPNIMWCSDGTKIFTIEDGWIWIFTVEEHWNAECLGWHVCKKGDRFAAFEAIAQAINKIFGSVTKGIATGLKLRIDHGVQYTSDYFLKQLNHLGVEDSFGLVKQPETNGVAERFNRTLKEQIFHGRAFRNVEEVREAMRQFVKQYNESWLLEKLCYKSPAEARAEHYKTVEVA